MVAVTSYDQRFRYFLRFVLRLCRPCEVNSETNMAGSSDPTKRGGGRRPLHYVPPGREGYTLAHLRERFSQGAGYIQPLQTDLDESPFSYEVNC